MNKSMNTDKLVPLLKELYDNDEYIEGVIDFANSDENIQIIIDFINHAKEINDHITSDDIAALALVLGNKEKKDGENE